MTKALGRLIFITVVCCFLLFTLLTLLRQIAPTVVVPPLNSPLLKEDLFLVTEPIFEAQGASLSNPRLPLYVESNNDIFLGLNLWVTADNQWVVAKLAKDSDLSQMSFQIEYLSLKELQESPHQAAPNSAGDAPTPESPEKAYIKSKRLEFQVFELSKLLEALAHKRYFLIFHSIKTRAIPRLINIIDKFKLNNHILIQSPQANILKQLRKYKARWLYGISPVTLGQAKLFVATWLEVYAPLDADFIFISDSEDLNNTRLVGEIHRRQRKIIVQIDKLTELPQNISIDGVFSPHQSIIKHMIEKNKLAPLLDD